MNSDVIWAFEPAEIVQLPGDSFASIDIVVSGDVLC